MRKVREQVVDIDNNEIEVIREEEVPNSKRKIIGLFVAGAAMIGAGLVIAVLKAAASSNDENEESETKSDEPDYASMTYDDVTTE